MLVSTLFVSFPALQLPLGKTTVMHLVAREHLPEPNNQGRYLGTRVGVELLVQPMSEAFNKDDLFGKSSYHYMYL
jgi:hypothetical protein